MRRFFVLLAVIAACAYPAGATADSPYDYVTGGGWVVQYNCCVDAHFAFTAHNGPSGVTGQMQLRYDYSRYPVNEGFPNEELTADVVCLTVLGNKAVLSGLITRAVNPAFGDEEGDYLTFTITDNGQPGSLVPDEFEALNGSLGPCAAPPGGGAFVTQGNINVNQGDPLLAPIWLF
jgi:hypothetical protein